MPSENKAPSVLSPDGIGEECQSVFFENASDGIFIVNLDGCIVGVNPIACQQLGYSREEMLQLSVRDIDTPEQSSAFRDLVKRLRSEPSVVFETEHRRKDGTRVPVEIHARWISYHGKSVIMGMVRDMTWRKRIENQLQEQVRFMASLMDALPIPVYYKNTDGRYTGCNQAFEEFTGKSRTNILGKTVRDILPKALAKRIEPKDEELFAGGGRQHYEWKWKRWDGAIRDVLLNKAAFTNSEGKVVGLIGAFLDVTERKETERVLRENEEKYRNLFENKLVAIALVDPESGKYLMVNKACEKMYGYSRAEFLEKLTVFDTSSEKDKTKRAFRNAFRKGGILIPRRYHRKKDGSKFPVEIATGTCVWAGRTVMFAVINDASARVAAEKALLELNRSLEEQVKQRTSDLENNIRQLNRYVAKCRRLERLNQELSEEERERIGRDIHDVLGQTLSAMFIKSQVLQTHLEKLRLAEAKEALMLSEIAQQAATQVRDLSRMLFPMELKKQNLDRALKDLADFMETNYGVACALEIKGASSKISDVQVATHAYRIAQEAVRNAVRHGKATHVRIRLSIGSRKGRLNIVDNGQGWASESKTSQGRGLEIMRYRAGLMGGKLSVFSRPERGAVITVDFPLLK